VAKPRQANGSVLVHWLSQWNREGPRARSRVRVEGEKRASLLRRVMNSRSVAARLLRRRSLLVEKQWAASISTRL